MTSIDKFIIYAPKGCTFRECELCKKPFVFDGISNNCLWCEIHKEDLAKPNTSNK